MSTKKIRLDHLLVEQQLASTREKAQALIMCGLILVNDKKIDKSGQLVPEDALIRILGNASPYVSRGREKLEGAFQAFQFSIAGKTALDVGLSTGGFSDFLLQNQVKYLFGVDVGYGQTDLKVRNNPKLAILERTNARELNKQDLITAAQKSLVPSNQVENISLVVMDYIVLIKPQFEAEKSQIGKGGIVKDPADQKAILDKVAEALSSHFLLIQSCYSPIKGTKGNQEYFFWLKNKTPSLQR